MQNPEVLLALYVVLESNTGGNLLSRSWVGSLTSESDIQNRRGFKATLVLQELGLVRKCCLRKDPGAVKRLHLEVLDVVRSERSLARNPCVDEFVEALGRPVVVMVPLPTGEGEPGAEDVECTSHRRPRHGDHPTELFE